MKERDDFEKYYNISGMLTKVTTFLFWVDVVLSALTIIIPAYAKPYCGKAQIFIALVYVVITVIDNCSSWYEAETGRIRDNVSNAFNSNLTEERTEGYYTNNEAPSVKRYAVNTYESAFYSREVSRAMVPYAIAKMTLAVMVVILVFLVNVDVTWALLVTQTAFSSVVILDGIHLLVFSSKVKGICKQFYTYLITNASDATISNQEAIFLSYAVEYEATKMYFKIRLSAKLFKRLKPTLCKKWVEILSQI